jgi:uncharacterized protein YecE (DUF72 family)
VKEFKQVEAFLDKLPLGYDYAIEFRHPSWQTEGPWEMLRHYNVAAAITDSPDPELQYLSNMDVNADHVFIRLHGRAKGYWYNYLYTKEQLKPWADKVQNMTKKTNPEAKRLRIYFNNHYGGQAVVNAIQFKEMIGEKASAQEKKTAERILGALREVKAQRKLDTFA